MAISVVRTATATISGAATGNITLDCTGGDLVVIGWSVYDPTLANRTIATVTVGGSSATIVAGSKSDNTTSTGQAQLAYFIAPSTGGQTVTITSSGSNMTNCDWYATLLSGAKQSAQPDSSGNHSTTGGTSDTVTITTIAANSFMFDAMNGNAGPMSIGAGQTSVMDLSGSTGRGSYKDAGAAGAGKTMVMTTGSNDDYAHGVIAIAPAAAATGNSNFLSFF